MKSRLLWLTAGGAVLILAASALQKPASRWVAERSREDQPADPPSRLETEFFDGWRGPDARAPVPMVSVPFSMRCSEPEPKIRSFTVENASHSLVGNFWFYRSDMPNFYSAQTLVATATAGKRTQTEKALALWALFPKYYYNDYPLPYRGMLLDPATLFAVIGTAQCSEAAPVLQTLCEMAGCETRLVGLDWQEGTYRIAHCAMEAKADGRWIYMDPDGHSVYRLANGEWAGVSDLIRDAGPVRRSVHAYYNPAVLANAFEKGKATFFEERCPFRLARQQSEPADYTPFHHYMRWDMLPGAKVTTFPEQRTKFFLAPLPESCNALLEWSCRAQDFATGRCEGVLNENVRVAVRGDLMDLQPADPDKPAALVIPMTSPYLVVGGRVLSRIASTGKVRLYVLPFTRGAFDTVESWHPIASLNGEQSLSIDDVLQNTPVFGYALRIEVPPGGAVVRRLEVQTWLQCASRALPYLAQGENQFTLYCQTPAAVVAASGDKADERIAFDSGLKLTFSLGATSQARGAPIP